jgi:hypothetical protein
VFDSAPVVERPVFGSAPVVERPVFDCVLRAESPRTPGVCRIGHREIADDARLPRGGPEARPGDNGRTEEVSVPSGPESACPDLRCPVRKCRG